MKIGDRGWKGDDLNFGVLIPRTLLEGGGIEFYKFIDVKFWAKDQDSPLLNRDDDKFDLIVDFAVCRIRPKQSGLPHQPLTLSVKRVVKDTDIFAIGYPQMEDIPVRIVGDKVYFDQFSSRLHVSLGSVTDVYLEISDQKESLTPGPAPPFRAQGMAATECKWRSAAPVSTNG